tara:strand:+ start:114 stop:299 length:186 start_codon:yes stop_codon:yes gene_type:complete
LAGQALFTLWTVFALGPLLAGFAISSITDNLLAVHFVGIEHAISVRVDANIEDDAAVGAFV